MIQAIWTLLALIVLVWFLDAMIQIIRKKGFIKRFFSGRRSPTLSECANPWKTSGCMDRHEKSLQAFQLRVEGIFDRHNEKILLFYGHTLRNGKRSYLSGMSFVQLFWIFVIASVLGSAYETVWCIVLYNRFEMRTSLVYGFFIPIYGFGAVMMSICLCRFYRWKSFWIFLGGAFIGAFVEYAFSLYQEIAFGTRSWDYSGTLLSLGGRTNLMFGLIWGILGVIWVKDLYPAMAKAIAKIPPKTGRALIILFSVIIVLDTTLTTMALIRQTERRNGYAATTMVQRYLDQTFSDSYLGWVYPHMKYIK